MTNTIILALSIFFTNQFPMGARDEFGGWGAQCCTYNAQLTYVVPASATTNVFVVEYNSAPVGPRCDNFGCWGMQWTELNTTSRVTMSPSNHNGFYTNLPSLESRTNTITFPIPYWDQAFFRVKRKFP
jgi:hypothetical protein